MTLEEAEDLTSSTLSDSTQMTLSNLSSQPMSVSIHSEISAVSQMSEAEKHEIEETIESETEEFAEGFDEMSESLTLTENDDDQSSLALDEKCVIEMKDSEKHVRFPGEETTTDVVYTNEQLTQSTEGVTDSASTITSPGDDVTSSVFAHCAVDEFSRGPPKEKSSQEEKELASMTSSQMTETEPMITSRADSEVASPETNIGVFDDTEFQGDIEIEAETPTSEDPSSVSGQTSLEQELESLVSPTFALEAQSTNQAMPEQSPAGAEKSPDALMGKHVSFDDESPDSLAEPKMDFSDFALAYGNGMHTNSHKALSYTSSLDVHAPSEVTSLHSDEPQELSPSPSDFLVTDPECPSQTHSDSDISISQVSSVADERSQVEPDPSLHSEVDAEDSVETQSSFQHGDISTATRDADIETRQDQEIETDIHQLEQITRQPPDICLIADDQPDGQLLVDQSNNNNNEIVISQADLTGPKSDLVVESLDSGCTPSLPLILTDISLVSKGISP